MDLSGFPNLLDRAFLEYRIRQTRQRLSVSLNSFANFLDFSPPIVNMWLNGTRLPSPGNVERIVPKLVELLDLDVYDSLGLPRPDLSLQRLTRVWPRIPLEYRQKLAEEGEKYATDVDKLAEGVDKSAVTGDKSAGEVETSAGEVEKSEGEVDKSAGEVDKSAGEVDMSTGVEEISSTEGEKGTSENEPAPTVNQPPLIDELGP